MRPFLCPPRMEGTSKMQEQFSCVGYTDRKSIPSFSAFPPSMAVYPMSAWVRRSGYALHGWRVHYLQGSRYLALAGEKAAKMQVDFCSCKIDIHIVRDVRAIFVCRIYGQKINPFIFCIPTFHGGLSHERMDAQERKLRKCRSILAPR